jgi:hypothetical protein
MDGSGHPVPDVKVYTDSWYGLDSTLSGPDGYYLLHLNWQSDYWLFADKPGWQFTYESLKSWELYEGAHYDWNPIGTWRGFIISGHVRDVHDRPLQGVGVSLSGDAESFDTTDVNGYYELRRFDPGSYTLTPEAARWVFWPAHKNIELTDSGKRHEDFTGRLWFQHEAVMHREPALVTIRVLPPETGIVTLRIVSLRGRVVWEMDRAARSLQEITIDWPACDAYGRQVASGVYIAVIRGAGADASHKIAIIR